MQKRGHLFDLEDDDDDDDVELPGDSSAYDDDLSEPDLVSPADSARRALRDIRRNGKLAQMGRNASIQFSRGRDIPAAMGRGSVAAVQVPRVGVPCGAGVPMDLDRESASRQWRVPTDASPPPAAAAASSSSSAAATPSASSNPLAGYLSIYDDDDAEEYEHKAAINPNVQPLDLTQEHDDEDDSPPLRRRLRKQIAHIMEDEEEEEEEEEEQKEEPSEELSLAQLARKDTEYEPGTVVRVAYNIEGDPMEHTGFGQVVRMNPIPVQTRGKEKFRTMVIKWLFDRNDLLEEEEDIDEETLEAVDFEDGDWAYSNAEQEVNVYDVMGIESPECSVDFYWDGITLRPIRENRNLGNGEDDLPAHLGLVKEWLLSFDVWRDAKLGRDWWFTLNSLLGMGHCTSNSSARFTLRDYFFDKENALEPLNAPITWDHTEPTKAKCDACGIQRYLTLESPELNWHVGKNCGTRIDVLAEICSYMYSKRKEAKAMQPKLPTNWLQAVANQLNKLRGKAMEAIAGEQN